MQRILNIGIPILAMALLLTGTYLGLVWAPPERMMGEVYRIMFVHVPSAWIALIAYTVSLVASVVYLMSNSWAADTLAEAAAEAGVLFNGIVLVTGSLWGRPTWGVYWTWDPRLTTAAIMFLAYAGYLALRRFVTLPEKRATWAAVVAIIVYADIPIVWFSVKWWNSLHQLQSSPATMGGEMVTALRVNAFAFLFLLIWFLRVRYRIGRRVLDLELSPAPPERVVGVA